MEKGVQYRSTYQFTDQTAENAHSKSDSKKYSKKTPSKHADIRESYKIVIKIYYKCKL